MPCRRQRTSRKSSAIGRRDGLLPVWSPARRRVGRPAVASGDVAITQLRSESGPLSVRAVLSTAVYSGGGWPTAVGAARVVSAADSVVAASGAAAAVVSEARVILLDSVGRLSDCYRDLAAGLGRHGAVPEPLSCGPEQEARLVHSLHRGARRWTDTPQPRPSASSGPPTTSTTPVASSRVWQPRREVEGPCSLCEAQRGKGHTAGPCLGQGRGIAW